MYRPFVRESQPPSAPTFVTPARAPMNFQSKWELREADVADRPTGAQLKALHRHSLVTVSISVTEPTGHTYTEDVLVMLSAFTAGELGDGVEHATRDELTDSASDSVSVKLTDGGLADVELGSVDVAGASEAGQEEWGATGVCLWTTSSEFTSITLESHHVTSIVDEDNRLEALNNYMLNSLAATETTQRGERESVGSSCPFM